EIDQNDLRFGNQIRKDLIRRAEGRRSSPLTAEGKRELALRSGVQPASASPTNFEERPEFKDLDPFIQKHGAKRLMAEADRIATLGKEAKRMDTRRIEFLDRPEVKNMLLKDPEMMMAVKAMAFER